MPIIARRRCKAVGGRSCTRNIRPATAGVNVAVPPATAPVSTGCVVTAGTVITVSVAPVVGTLATVFVNTARYWVPLSLKLWVGVVYVVLVAFGMSTQLGASTKIPQYPEFAL